MTLEKIKLQLKQTLKEHYAFDQPEFDDMFKWKYLKELDMDSIALLELYLVVEDGFNLNVKLSDRLDMTSMMDKKMEDFEDAIAMEILKIYKEAPWHR